MRAVLLVALLAIVFLAIPASSVSEATALQDGPSVLNNCKRGCVRGAHGAFNNAWRGTMAACVVGVGAVSKKLARRICLPAARSAGAWAFRDHYDRCMSSWCD